MTAVEVDVVFTGWCWPCGLPVEVTARGVGAVPDVDRPLLPCPLCGAESEFGWHLTPPSTAADGGGVVLPDERMLEAIVEALVSGRGWQPSMAHAAARTAIEVLHTLTMVSTEGESDG